MILTPDNLLSTHNGVAAPDLRFIITDVKNGFFTVAGDIPSNVTFLQQQVTAGQVAFSQHSVNMPAYNVSVTDGRITMLPEPAKIIFYIQPILQKNQLALSRGQTLSVSTDDIAATRGGQLAGDLQFVITGEVMHGHFEYRSDPGAKITVFSQQEILQSAVQFVHDGSAQPPNYSLSAQDRQTNLTSPVRAAETLLLVNNDFPVNQGQILSVTSAMLGAVSNRPDEAEIQFSIVNQSMMHGHFARMETPDTPLWQFSQTEVDAEGIILTPDSDSFEAPSSVLMVSDGKLGGVNGTFACGIDFDIPPVLGHAYLKTSVSEVVKLTDVNLQAMSYTRPSGSLIFEISEVQRGYFAENRNWQVSVNNFSQQQILNNEMVFITDNSGIAPNFQASVWDGRLHCTSCPQPAEIVFPSSGSTNDGISSVIKSSLIGALVSGGVGLLFFAVKWYLNYKHTMHLQRTVRPTIDGEAQDLYSDVLLLPIAREIFSRIKISGCLGYISQEQYNEYIGAVSLIVAALETREIIQPQQWNIMTRPQKQKIIDAIATQTKQIVGNNRCCSTRTFTSFYKAEVTPKMIRDRVEEIADAVQETLSEHAEAKNSRRPDNVRLTRTSSSLNDNSQLRTSLLGRS